MMNGQKDGAVTLPKNVSVTIGGRTFQGECPERLLVPEHKLRKTTEKKKGSVAGKSINKAD
jgi:hypothetical protein